MLKTHHFPFQSNFVNIHGKYEILCNDKIKKSILLIKKNESHSQLYET